jgi:hypothetical protein
VDRAGNFKSGLYLAKVKAGSKMIAQKVILEKK